MVERPRFKGKFISSTPTYQPLLSYKEVKNWIDLYRSKNTRDNYLRGLDFVTKSTGLNPAKLVKLPEKKAKEAVMGVVRDYIQADKLMAARITQTAMKGFFEANGKTLSFTRRDRVKVALKKMAYEHVPTKEEVYRMVDNLAGKPRNKAMILCLFQSGVRVSCLCNWTYDMVKDQLYPEVKVPVRLKITNQVDAKLSGYELGYYYTFLAQEAAEVLREYLDTRGKLKAADSIFTPANTGSLKTTIGETAVYRVVKHAVKNIGLDPKTVWVHSLRKTFRKVLYAAEVDPDFCEAIMGHKLPGSRGNYFDYHDMDGIAANYMKANFSRTTTQVTEETMKEIRRQQLRRDMKELYGLDLEEILKPK